DGVADVLVGGLETPTGESNGRSEGDAVPQVQERLDLRAARGTLRADGSLRADRAVCVIRLDAIVVAVARIHAGGDARLPDVPRQCASIHWLCDLEGAALGLLVRCGYGRELALVDDGRAAVEHLHLLRAQHVPSRTPHEIAPRRQGKTDPSRTRFGVGDAG